MQTIHYWPNDSWCHKEELENYMRYMGLSDDYATISLELDDEQIDEYVHKINRTT